MKKLAVFVALVAFAGVASAADGSAVYAKRCAACHGKDGKGDTPIAKKLGVKDLTATALSEAEVAQIVAEGKGKMNGFKGKMTDEEIQAVAAHVKSGLK